MTRAQAIERLVLVDLEQMSLAQRAEQLETMSLEDWSNSPGWSDLAADVRAELEEGQVARDPSSRRYDAVLLLWLRSRYVGASNSYLHGRLKMAGCDDGEVLGPVDVLLPCPCCGRATLSERGSYEICEVCWWEDDGQDNADADRVLGGPNADVSLTQGRANFLIHGIFDPSRDDLRALQDPPDKYPVVRTFLLSPDGRQVMERASHWISRAFVR